MLTAVYTSNLSTKRNMTNINHLIEDEVRDDECVVIETQKLEKVARIIHYVLVIR